MSRPESRQEVPNSGITTPRSKPLMVPKTKSPSSALPSEAGGKAPLSSEPEAQLRRNLLLEVEKGVAEERRNLRERVRGDKTARGGGTGLRVSASTDAMPRVSSMDELGEGGSRDRMHRPSRGSKEACRFHLQLGPGTPGTPRAMRERSADCIRSKPGGMIELASNAPRHEECRYFQGAKPRARSVSAERQRGLALGLASSGSGAAGVAPIRRYDTPGGLIERLGKTRSTTPEYHHRYSLNMIGSSLGGSGLVGIASQGSEGTSASTPLLRGSAAALPPAAIREADRSAPWARDEAQGAVTCVNSRSSRQYAKAPPRAQAMNLSSRQGTAMNASAPCLVAAH